MTEERSSTPAHGITRAGSASGVAAALVGGVLLAYACAGYGVYTLLSAIL